LGHHVVRELLDEGHDVVAVDVSTEGIDPRAQVSTHDIFSDPKGLVDQFGAPDVLVHLAWKDGFSHNSYAHMDNLSSHFVFLRTMVELGCPQISVMGTMHEVGYWEGAITESTPCNPLSQYGVAKNALRQSMTLLAQSLGFRLLWLRAYYIVGDDARGNSIFAKITQAAAEGQKEFPFTSGKNKCDFIDIDELAAQIATASTQDRVTGIVNVCSGVPVSLADRVEQFIADHEYDITLAYGTFPDRPYDSPEVYGDATRIREIMAGAEDA